MIPFRLASLFTHLFLGATVFYLSTRRRRTVFTNPARLLAVCIATSEFSPFLRAVLARRPWLRAAIVSDVLHVLAVSYTSISLVRARTRFDNAPSPHIDTLTRAPNREAFHERLTSALAIGHRRGQPAAVIFMDLDRFKEINDLHGHAVGDLVLVEVTRCLEKLLRNQCEIYRIGGDEFATIVSNSAHVDLHTLMTSIRECIEKPIGIEENGTFAISASVGFAKQEAEDDVSSLMKRADSSMYAEKRARKNAINLRP